MACVRPSLVLLCLVAVCQGASVFNRLYHPFGKLESPQCPASTCQEVDISKLLAQGLSPVAVQNSTKVDPPIGKFPSYAGFATTNADSTNHMFWWFFPAQQEPMDSTPTLIWLQGGPGGSSMFGLFSEMGPLELTPGGDVVQRNATWNVKYNMIFIDNPVGAGFSYTDDDSGYCNDTKKCVASNLYSLMQQFYKVFPDVRKTDLYVTGESYGGHYVPGFAAYIHEQNKAGTEPKIPLAGVAIGDGWIDPVNMIPAYPDLMFNLGLADTRQKFIIEEYCVKAVEYIRRDMFLESFEVWDRMLNGDVFPYPNYFHNITGSNDYDNFLRTNAPESFGYYGPFLNKASTRASLHVGTGRPFPFNPTTCEHHLLSDFMVSFTEELVTLLGSYKVLVYSGQLDIIIGAALTEAFLQRLIWPGTAAYREAERLIWKVEDADAEVAGYVRSIDGNAGNFTQVVIRSAGHIVPYDQPRVALDMITRFVENKPFVN